MAIRETVLTLIGIKSELAAGFRSEPVALADDIDQRIATLLNVPLAPFTTSMDAAFALMEAVFEGERYVNPDFREYLDMGERSFLCDIKTENSDAASGQASTRARALVSATVGYAIYLCDIKTEQASTRQC